MECCLGMLFFVFLFGIILFRPNPVIYDETVYSNIDNINSHYDDEDNKVN